MERRGLRLVGAVLLLTASLAGMAAMLLFLFVAGLQAEGSAGDELAAWALVAAAATWTGGTFVAAVELSRGQLASRALGCVVVAAVAGAVVLVIVG